MHHQHRYQKSTLPGRAQTLCINLSIQNACLEDTLRKITHGFCAAQWQIALASPLTTQEVQPNQIGVEAIYPSKHSNLDCQYTIDHVVFQAGVGPNLW